MYCWCVLSLRGIVSADKVSQLSVNDDVRVKIRPLRVVSHCSRLAGTDPRHPSYQSVTGPVNTLTAFVCQLADSVVEAM